MTSLLSFDFEFTHPTPGIGAPMALGCVAFEYDAKNMRFGEKNLEFYRVLPVPAHTRVTDWVQKNQSALLKECRREVYAKIVERKAELVDYLRRVKEEFGGEVIPVGHTLGSDFAYLLHMLEENNDLVSYSARDLTGIVTGITGEHYTSDDDLKKLLGREDLVNADEHNALEDAKYQAELIKAALSYARMRARRNRPEPFPWV